MRSVLRSRTAAIGVTAGLVLGSSVLLASPASAAPGDASALGAGVALTGTVPGLVALDATAAVGLVTAGTGGAPGAFDSQGSTLATVQGGEVTVGAVSTRASSTTTGSSASSDVAGAAVSLLGIDVLTADAVTADVTCPVGGGGTTADAGLVGLTLFGTAATLDATTPTVSASAALAGDLLGATLTVDVSRVEQARFGSATATSIVAALTLSGTVGDTQIVDVPLGTVTLASAACESPTAGAAAQITATGITPVVGPTSGGQVVTITGTGFTPDTTVTFGTLPAAAVTVAADGNSLTATTPASPAGPVTVTVTDPTAGSAELAYTYVAPAITAIDPTQGPAVGGTTVTLTGTGLDTITGVTFDGTPGTVVSVSPDGTQVVVTSPAGTGVAEVVLTAPAGVTTTAPSPFVYVSPGGPAVVSISPTAGPTAGGQTVVVSGTGLAGVTDVTFGGVAATIVGTPTDTRVTVVTPAGVAGPVDVVLDGADGAAVLEDGYTYLAEPGAASVDPGSGSTTGGDTVTVIGGPFVPGATTVTICGVTIPATAVTVSADGTRLTFVTPACVAGATTIVVTTAGGASDALPFTYVAPAAIVPAGGDRVAPRPVGGTRASGLAYTGSDGTGGVLLGSALMLTLGTALLVGARRRAARDGGAE
ncbi:beta strand repeat-containing protein [Frigoribacterium endophyticum]|uniref:beta strand repeat-containing protein n=1 Tax=Frigoribacterium endophyticum TaxID=1522176 RepID=UPI001423F48F|nr:IPT/TIG domain-containing protein [Frigoribacterium endophyticum]NII52338.1 hypothetical protein [Frigoribacterium endophyticum]